ncbi:MAG TPA: SLATT domain-containing protein [Acetobacteraceae bacterium]|nr:SLATT domain-containing protein [Acetobacteraceae bacterium]
MSDRPSPDANGGGGKLMNRESRTLGLLNAWAWRAERAIFAHYATARRLDSRHRIMGTALIFSSAAAAVLSGRQIFGVTQPVVDGVSILASATAFGLACIQVFLRDADRSESYRKAAARYAAMKRELEQHLARENVHALSDGEISLLRKGIDELGESALPIPKKVWAIATKDTLDGKRSFRLMDPDNHTAT